MFWSYKGNLTTAAHVWAAAAGTAGAIAPRHIVNALMEGHYLLSAAIEGTKRADQEADPDFPSPRGCSLLVERGTVSLNWETEGHRILLSEEAGAWYVTIHCRHDSGGECDRTRAASAARELWEKHGGTLRRASSDARHGVARAATVAARMMDSEEIVPAAAVDSESSRGLSAIWGILWTWKEDEALSLVEELLGYTPDITPEGGVAGIVIGSPLVNPDLDDTSVALRPRGTMAAILSGRLRDLDRPEYDSAIHALGVVAGVEEATP